MKPNTGAWPIGGMANNAILAIGVYPAIGLIEARAARDEAKRNLAADIDPSVVKQERKRAAKLRLTTPSRPSRASGTKTGKVRVVPTTLPRSSDV